MCQSINPVLALVEHTQVLHHWKNTFYTIFNTVCQSINPVKKWKDPVVTLLQWAFQKGSQNKS